MMNSKRFSHLHRPPPRLGPPLPLRLHPPPPRHQCLPPPLHPPPPLPPPQRQPRCCRSLSFASCGQPRRPRIKEIVSLSDISWKMQGMRKAAFAI